jgi:hypothetical protein
MFRGKPLVEVIRCPAVGVAVGVAIVGEVSVDLVVAKRGESPRVVAVPSAML